MWIIKFRIEEQERPARDIEEWKRKVGLNKLFKISVKYRTIAHARVQAI